MTRVSKKAPAKKKAPSARTQKKQTRTVGLAKGGAPKSKSRVNEAGNYTKPGMRKRIRKQGAATSNNETRLPPVCLSWHGRRQASS
jgi:hypothetical protein